jgi:hypothetical protein
LLILGNPDYEWLADESGYVSSRAAHEVWKAFGVGDRFGCSIVADHPHCRLPDSQRPEVEAFVDKFLLGDTDAKTDVMKHPFPDVDYARWIGWWGKSQPTFPGADDAYSITLEAECGNVGANWEVFTEGDASNGRFATPKVGSASVQTAPAGGENFVTIPFTLDKGGNFTVFARIHCPTEEDDSCWIKMDDGEFTMRNGLSTSGWQWITMEKYALEPGEHSVTFGFREDGFKLDKLCLSTFFLAPEALGPVAGNICDP